MPVTDSMEAARAEADDLIAGIKRDLGAALGI